MEEEVFRVRSHACDVLEKAGTTRGRVMRHFRSRREDANLDMADVIWQGEFTDAASLAKYEEIADKNPDFIAARREMGMFIRKGERRYFEVQ